MFVTARRFAALEAVVDGLRHRVAELETKEIKMNQSISQWAAQEAATLAGLSQSVQNLNARLQAALAAAASGGTLGQDDLDELNSILSQSQALANAAAAMSAPPGNVTPIVAPPGGSTGPTGPTGGDGSTTGSTGPMGTTGPTGNSGTLTSGDVNPGSATNPIDTTSPSAPGPVITGTAGPVDGSGGNQVPGGSTPETASPSPGSPGPAGRPGGRPAKP